MGCTSSSRSAQIDGKILFQNIRQNKTKGKRRLAIAFVCYVVYTFAVVASSYSLTLVPSQEEKKSGLKGTKRAGGVAWPVKCLLCAHEGPSLNSKTQKSCN